jgi:hypothetical protein
MLQFKHFSELNESSSADIKDLLHHVTKESPTMSNIVSMHDKIRSISKTHGISSDKLYDRVRTNPWAHEKYKEAAS